jgi:uncharacterized protein YdhG (YjbR/CyaY superfamily)
MLNDIDSYIQACDAAVQPALNEIRRTVRAAIPDANEVLSYKMPALKKQRVFFYYAAFKTHIGIYPPVTNDKELIKELAPYANEKGNLRFPLAKPIPYELIVRVALALDKQYSK